MILLHLSSQQRAPIASTFELFSHLVLARLTAIELGMEVQADRLMTDIENAGAILEATLKQAGVIEKGECVTFDLERERIVMTNEAGEDLWLLPQGVVCTAPV